MSFIKELNNLRSYILYINYISHENIIKDFFKGLYYYIYITWEVKDKIYTKSYYIIYYKNIYFN